MKTQWPIVEYEEAINAYRRRHRNSKPKWQRRREFETPVVEKEREGERQIQSRTFEFLSKI